MTDDKTDRGNPDRQRISLSEDYEVRDWADKFGVSQDRLREAVRQVGNEADEVQRFLERG